MVRAAAAADVPAIVAWGRDFYAASHWAGLANYDADRAATVLAALIEGTNSAVFISERGFIAVVLVPLWCGDVLTLQELCFWTTDGQGTALRSAAEAWAASNDGQIALMGAHEPGDIDRIDKWYRRGGYEPHGRIFRKVLSNGH